MTSFDKMKVISVRVLLSIFIGLVPLFVQGSGPTDLELVEIRSFIPGFASIS